MKISDLKQENDIDVTHKNKPNNNSAFKTALYIQLSVCVQYSILQIVF